LNPASLTSFHPDFIAEAEAIADDIVTPMGAGIGRTMDGARDARRQRQGGTQVG